MAGLVRTFRFKITLLAAGATPADAPQQLGDGGFAECTGLEVEHDVQTWLEGGRNDAVVRRIGRAKYNNIVLKRGMFYGDDGGLNRQLWHWLQSILAGTRPVVRYDGLIEVYKQGFEPVATWEFDRALPARIRGPQLDAKNGEVAIEELELAHEGLRLTNPGGGG